MVYKIGNRVTVAEPTLIWIIQRTSLLASPLWLIGQKVWVKTLITLDIY